MHACTHPQLPPIHSPLCSTGTLPGDDQLARWLRKSLAVPGSVGTSGYRVVVAANKCERLGAGGEATVAAALADTSKLGFGEPVALSAMTGEGMSDLYEALQPLLDPLVALRQAAVQQIEAPSSSGGDGGSSSRASSASLQAATDVATSTSSNGSGGEGSSSIAASGPAPQQELASGDPEATSSSSSSGSKSSASSSSGPLRIAIMGLPNVVSCCCRLPPLQHCCAAAQLSSHAALRKPPSLAESIAN
jgi:predicted GTPase